MPNPFLDTVLKSKRLMLIFGSIGICIASATGLLFFEMNRHARLHLAICNGEIEAVRKILRERPSAVNNRDKLGHTPLHLAVIFGHPEIASLLLEKGADANASGLPLQNGDRNWTPLHFAADSGKTEIVRILILNGADSLARTGNGNTARDLAIGRNHLAIIELLSKKDK
ncbi:MAG: ankyrin repeat domain-containing protein [Gemmataceae bacterium]|nr:ankyrin repeat domain-containing protein [Gemmataceae bacterium]